MNLGMFQGEKEEGETAHHANESVSLHILFSAFFGAFQLSLLYFWFWKQKLSVNANLVSFERRANKLERVH